MKINVYVIYGGKSVEHEVSIKSAHFIINSINKDKYNVYPVYITKSGKWCCLEKVNEFIEDSNKLLCSSSTDIYKSIGNFLNNDIDEENKNIVFPALHGSFGEDGTIQGLLEMLNIPYVGNGVEASSIGIDKCMMRNLFKGNEIPQPNYYILNSCDLNKGVTKLIKNQIGLPCYVKPARLGSSVGISRCESEDELINAINNAFMFDNKIIIEKEVIGREVQVLVTGNDDPISSYVGEIIQDNKFLDYEIKYTDGMLSHIIPAKIVESISKELRKLAIKIYKMLNCSGLLRIDYFLTDNNQIFLNEVNTMPGFTKVSMAPDLWRATYNTKCDEFIDELIKLGFERHDNNKHTLFSRR
ncbi:D-alanine--D-alanine ligase family protein [Mycoplasmatota bacterium WC44]